MNKSMLSMAIMTALIASGAGAVETTMPESQPRPSRSARPAAGQERQADKLASEFGVPRDEVNTLRQKGLGWGEVRQALTLSRESGKPVDDIIRMHDEGLSWDEISKKEGVKFDSTGKPIEKKGARSDMNRGTDRGTMDRGTMDRRNPR